MSFVGPVKLQLTIFALSFLLDSLYHPTSVYDVRIFLNFDPAGVLTA